MLPYYILDSEFASLVARNFDRVRVFMAPEKKFKQCVIFGIKRRSDAPAAHVLNQLAEASEGKAIELPEVWPEAPYEVPAMTDAEEYSFTALRIDAAQLKNELAKFAGSTLWPQFCHHFTTVRREHRRPLHDLSKWHLALALAAGQICGVVKSASGRTLLVKGNTFKEKEIAIDRQVDEGGVQETRTLTDKFVPVIRGIDFTPGPGFGNVVTIR